MDGIISFTVNAMWIASFFLVAFLRLILFLAGKKRLYYIKNSKLPDRKSRLPVLSL